MGAMNAMSMAEEEFPLRAKLEWHLQSNHYPPIDTVFIDSAIKAIDCMIDEEPETEIKLPNGKILSAFQIFEELHLEFFVEQRMEEKKTKYISHVAYHLYQMYLHKDDVRKKKETGVESEELREPQDDEMQLEINRVASTLIRLMEVMR